MRRFVPAFVMSAYHFLLAWAAAARYGFPSRRLTVIGITGTNGKSTTVELAHRIFEEAGFKVASTSSVRFNIAGAVEDNAYKMTMPGRFFQQRFLRRALDAGCTIAILEVTSEGIRQHRHRFIQFDIAAMTNVTPEHIESHGGFDRYLACKLRLFSALSASSKPERRVVVNGDDPHARDFLSFVPNDAAFVYGLRFSPNAYVHEVRAETPIAIPHDGARFSYGGFDFNLKLKGEFNIYNALAALSIGLARNIPVETIRRALESIDGVSGRMEFIARDPFSVVVDYAHTPDALERVYQALKKDGGRLICVLGGTGGGRDTWKRPKMGEIADAYCDEIILTNEDPYDEDPESIIKDVGRGISKKTFRTVIDRKVAIEEAVRGALPGDTVIVTGKGSEPLMAVAGGQKVPWDDREIARSALVTRPR